MLKQYFLSSFNAFFEPVSTWLFLLTLFISSVVFNKALLKEIVRKNTRQKIFLILLQFCTNSDLSHIIKSSIDKVFMLVIFESEL